MIATLQQWLHQLFEVYKLVRRFLIFWAVALITWIMIDTVQNHDQITTPVAAVYKQIILMFTVIIGFYQWSRGRDK